MFGFGKSSSVTEPVFIVGDSKLFKKTRLSPMEFGQEIVRLGFAFGVEQFERYQKAPDHSAADRLMLLEVNKNPGIIQLLYANLIAGAFLCCAKVLLRAPAELLPTIEAGMLAELRAKCAPALSEHVLVGHQHITADFAIAIEREIRQIEENSSLNILWRYITDYYPGVNSSILPPDLATSAGNLGSFFMNICHTKMQLSLQLP